MVKKLVQGNEAIAYGALKAGMKFFAGYPITPASEIMHTLAKEKSIKFIHAEDELASIHMCIGGSLGSAKSMTATSGPGFSLMQEGIGLGHMMEIPLVIVNCQRVGPSTGMPTLSAQGDVMQARWGSHGDYYPIVFYPNSVAECYKYTIEAFNAAEESLSPIILLSDTNISHIYETVDFDEIDKEVKIVGRKLEPIGKGTRHFTGLTHKGDYPATKDTQAHRDLIKKFKEKTERVAQKYNFYEYIENKSGGTLLIAYGITSRVILPLKEKFGIFRPIRMFPVLDKELKKAAKDYKNIVVIEMNDGQYAQEVERILKREVKTISQLGGTVRLSEIEQELKDLSL